MKVIFSVVIPTLNEEKTLPRLLDTIIRSSHKYKIEVIIIDSGSTDNTSSLIRYYKTKFYRCIFKEITRSEFNHGGTRNLGARLATGEYVLYVSADANILSNSFFDRIYNDFEKFPEAMVMFSKQKPYENTSYIQKIDIINLFENLDRYANQSGLVVQNIKKPFIPYTGKNDYIWFFLSNVFACYRRAFLIDHPFQITQHGEDMLMGKEIITKGFTKIYDSQLIVQHSHSFSPYGYYKALLIDHKLKYFKLRLHYQINLKTKIQKIFNLDISIFEKTKYLLSFMFYYAIKIFVYSTIFFTKLFTGINLNKKISRGNNI